MTAGGGIMHEEMPKPRDGSMAGFQLWVNLPSELKMSEPRYQEILAETIPAVDWEDGGVVRVIAGEFGGATGPVREIAASPTYLDVTLLAGMRFDRPTEGGHTFMAYLFEGDGDFGSSRERVEAPALVVFDDGEELEIVSGDQGVRFLLFSGLPRNEPIVRYGPFVMNTEDEIRQALEDLNSGTFVYGS
jgi:redox-sensitive bicupin YhaK (pirin superfamily)